MKLVVLAACSQTVLCSTFTRLVDHKAQKAKIHIELSREDEPQINAQILCVNFGDAKGKHPDKYTAVLLPLSSKVKFDLVYQSGEFMSIEQNGIEFVLTRRKGPLQRF